MQKYIQILIMVSLSASFNLVYGDFLVPNNESRSENNNAYFNKVEEMVDAAAFMIILCNKQGENFEANKYQMKVNRVITGESIDFSKRQRLMQSFRKSIGNAKKLMAGLDKDKILLNEKILWTRLNKSVVIREFEQKFGGPDRPQTDYSDIQKDINESVRLANIIPGSAL